MNFTLEIEVYYSMLFDRSLFIFSKTSLKQYMEHFNFRCSMQLDLPVAFTTLMWSSIIASAASIHPFAL